MINKCPNCNKKHSGLYIHTCHNPDIPDFGHFLDRKLEGVTHCGCYYEADSKDIKCHVSWHCLCTKAAHGFM